MRLKEGFITQDLGGTQVMVAVQGNEFNGLARSNRTAAFIVDLLKEETTEEKITEAMLERYDAPKTQIEADVHRIIGELKKIGAIAE